jgi:hypothetical protein
MHVESVNGVWQAGCVLHSVGIVSTVSDGGYPA